jgi:glucosamine kinase
MTHFLAVDGGGTNCRAAIATRDGVIVGRATTGPANMATDPAGAARNIVEAARAALADAGLAGFELARLPAYLGIAGANVSDDNSAFVASLPFAPTRIVGDWAIALHGALGDHDGILAVLGTGSVYIARRGDEHVRVGGWGFMVGDLGSGARLGRALLQDTLLAHDRILPRSVLTRDVMREFNDDPNALVAFAQAAKPGEFARFAPMVFDYAGRGDEVGASLVAGAVRHVDAALAACAWEGCSRLSMTGGLAPLYRERIAPHFRAMLSEPLADALTGAVQLGAAEFRTA